MMAAQKPSLTPSGLLSESHGRRPFSVRIREEKAGGPVILDFGKPRQWESLGFPARALDARKRWVWDFDALERARDAAENRSAELRLGQLRQAAAPEVVTVGAAFALSHDPERGGLPAGLTSVYAHRRARREWEEWLGKDTPWNSITPGDVEALVERYRKRKMIPTARELLKNLRACYHWLRKKRKLRLLEDPTEGLEMRDVMRGHRPRRPRYTPEEARRIVAVRDQVDPRFSLFIALMDDSGARGQALRLTMRSGLDGGQDFRPSQEDAPHGWLVLPALKEQEAPVVFLTSFQRREIERALVGYLRELEKDFQEHGVDYPLFPAARVRDVAHQVIRPRRQYQRFEERTSYGKTGRSREGQSRAFQPISRARTREWLIEAEEKAGIPHVEGRGFHGLRRAVSDYLEEETDLGTLTAAMAWSSQRTPEQIYLDKGKHAKRARARQAMEKKRSTPEGGE